MHYIFNFSFRNSGGSLNLDFGFFFQKAIHFREENLNQSYIKCEIIQVLCTKEVTFKVVWLSFMSLTADLVNCQSLWNFFQWIFIQILQLYSPWLYWYQYWSLVTEKFPDPLGTALWLGYEQPIWFLLTTCAHVRSQTVSSSVPDPVLQKRTSSSFSYIILKPCGLQHVKGCSYYQWRI